MVFTNMIRFGDSQKGDISIKWLCTNAAINHEIKIVEPLIRYHQ